MQMVNFVLFYKSHKLYSAISQSNPVVYALIFQLNTTPSETTISRVENLKWYLNCVGEYAFYMHVLQNIFVPILDYRINSIFVINGKGVT